MEDEQWDPERLTDLRKRFEDAYHAVKAQALRAGTLGLLSPPRMVAFLEALSALHRIVDQAAKAARFFEHFLWHSDDGLAPQDSSAAAGSDAAPVDDAATDGTDGTEQARA